jgi:hypothetical protein
MALPHGTLWVTAVFKVFRELLALRASKVHRVYREFKELLVLREHRV